MVNVLRLTVDVKSVFIKVLLEGDKWIQVALKDVDLQKLESVEQV